MSSLKRRKRRSSAKQPAHPIAVQSGEQVTLLDEQDYTVSDDTPSYSLAADTLNEKQLKTVLATALQDPDARGIILRIIDQVQAEVRPDTISRGLEETATTLKTEKETPAAEGETANETAERETALQKTGHESTAQVERGHETTGPEPTSQEAEGKDTSKETVTNESSNIEEGVCGSERAHH